MEPNTRRAQADITIGCARSVDTAVYLLDGLDTAEREEFARHLGDCRGCRAEVDELAPIARLLAIARRHLVRPGWS